LVRLNYFVTQMSVETSSQDADAEGVPLPVGMTPADLMAELVTALPERDGEDHLVYERDGEWTLASGVQAAIELDSDELRLIAGGRRRNSRLDGESRRDPR
jgi:salicylate synthetase